MHEIFGCFVYGMKKKKWNYFCREKKREKERDELWKRLAELELNHGMRATPPAVMPPSNHSSVATVKK